ncbi:four-carbon acid sugar kinase family protein [Fictibacillus enclensis]|uniref:four-carbon acid sugar kinase family protein n=1 Tax=Fictibacillus enclensis TaxID=1017270 RepID=UPI0024BFB435|nr:four-carbon acid sugar kinase family protein [Fictibacillus enclensis]WHY72918.1 four-carbon acid sugar kinase family protein [Fictibacillus enclensis]
MTKNQRVSANLLETLPTLNKNKADALIQEALGTFNKKIIVLDDDPTGVQTVHDISVFTDWSLESIEKGFLEEQSMFFILTNSRGFTEEETAREHIKIAENILVISKKRNRDFLIISRGDSTLRGHYPLETTVLKETIESASEKKIDGEVILPFFKEGGRFTINNIHYVQDGGELVPAGETEFAKDRTFGYTKSDLGEWIEEKSRGEYKAADTLYLSIEALRSRDVEGIARKLMEVKDFNKVVVNAADEGDVKIFTAALIQAINAGKNFLFRSAAALPKVIGGVQDKALLTRNEMIQEETGHGGLIIIGSHVKKTTEQLERLKKIKEIEFIEFNSHLVLEPERFKQETDRVIETTESLVRSGKTVAVYTSRERLDLGENKKEEELKLSVAISDAVTSIVTRLQVKPNFLIAKGGITSSDVGTKGLNVKRATVAGQVRPGIPVWRTGDESKYPGMSYVIFPGNVGTKSDLKEVTEMLIHP